MLYINTLKNILMPELITLKFSLSIFFIYVSLSTKLVYNEKNTLLFTFCKIVR